VVRQTRRPPWRCALLLTVSLAGGCAAAGATPAATPRPSLIPLPTCPAEPLSHQDAVRLFEGDRSGTFDVEDRLDWLAETLGSDWKPGARRRRVCRNCGGDAASQPAPPLMSSIAQFAGACLQSRAHLPSVGVRALL